MVTKSIRGIEQIDCRAFPGGGGITCILSKHSASEGVSKDTRVTSYISFEGDVKTYMTPTGVTSYRPKGGKMQCKVTGDRMECSSV